MAEWLRNPTRTREGVGLVSGLAQWVKDLPWAVGWVADVARIWHCCDWHRLAAVALI